MAIKDSEASLVMDILVREIWDNPLASADTFRSSIDILVLYCERSVRGIQFLLLT